MTLLEQLIHLWGLIPTRQMTVGLGLVAIALVLVEDHRLALVPMTLQYLLANLLVGTHLYRPVALIRLGLGLAVCLILSVTTKPARVGARARRRVAGESEDTASLTGNPHVGVGRLRLGTPFRLLAAGLAGVLSYGLWRNYPLGTVPHDVNLASYWLISSGFLLILIGGDPLRIGYGILTLVNGFEMLFLYWEEGFLVVGLLGVVNILVAMAIAVYSEAWFESARREAEER